MSRALKHLSIDAMIAEIRRRKKLLDQLNRRRSALLKKLFSVETDIKNAGGEITPISAGAITNGSAARYRNTQSLADAMHACMSRETAMTVAEIEKAVIKYGYRSSSSTFRTIIFQTLGKDKRFKKQSRGQYLLK